MSEAKLVNLLPASKQSRLQQQRRKHLFISLITAVIIVAVAVPIVLFVVKQSQSLLLSRTQTEINKRKEELGSTPDITTMLSVKDHLNALPQLYDQRLGVSKLLEHLPSLTPTEINFNNLTVDTATNSISITGVSTSYYKVAQFYLALQRANVDFDPQKVEPDPDKVGDFTTVVLQDVGGPSGEEVTFTITASFNAEIIKGVSTETGENNGQN